MTNKCTISEVLKNSPLGIVSGFFRSNLPIEVLWGVTVIELNPAPEHFEANEFRQWIEKTWGLRPKPERLKDMLLPYIEGMGGWKLQLEVNGIELEQLQIPFTMDTYILSMGATHTDYADKVVFADKEIYLQLQFNQSLVKSNWGNFMVKSVANDDIFGQPHNILYAHPIPLV